MRLSREVSTIGDDDDGWVKFAGEEFCVEADRLDIGMLGRERGCCRRR